MHNPLTGFLFNSSALVAGQHVAIGGPDSGAVSATNVTVDRIHLRNWGFNGTIVAGSENSSQGTFQMQVNGFAGVLVPETITVYLGGNCDFRYGLGAFTDLTDGATVRVVGLLLKNPSNGNVILWARHVDGLTLPTSTRSLSERAETLNETRRGWPTTSSGVFLRVQYSEFFPATMIRRGLSQHLRSQD